MGVVQTNVAGREFLALPVGLIGKICPKLEQILMLSNGSKMFANDNSHLIIA